MSQRQYARLIVCEPTPRWAVLLRRFAAETPVSETRSLALADEMLAASPASFLVVPASSLNAAATLTRLAHWQIEFPLSVSAILLDEPNPELEFGCREVGAQLVISSLFDLPLLVRLAQRHLAQVEEPELEWREAIAARMPWGSSHQIPGPVMCARR